jgi:hypothetical protein
MDDTAIEPLSTNLDRNLREGRFPILQSVLDRP